MPVFAAGDREVTAEQVLAAADWRGQVAGFRKQWENRQHAAQAAEAAGQTARPEAVEAVTDSFRYARGLIAAEECEQWLAQRGLTFDDLHAHATRQVLAAQAGEVRALGRGRLEECVFLQDVLLAEEFSAWARALAWRMAWACHRNVLPPPNTPRADLWTVLEDAFAAARSAHLTTARRQQELAGHRLALLRCIIESAEFGTEPAAREAVLCAREDGRSLADVATANGFPVQRHQAFLGDLPDDWQAALLNAQAGDVTSPLVGHGGGLVLQLLDKREPTLDCPEVGARVDAQLSGRFFGELESRHIRWLLNLEVDA